MLEYPTLEFKVLKAAVARAFEDTDLDPDQFIEEYVKLKHLSEVEDSTNSSHFDSKETIEGNRT